jgi:signal transduction histidine kinase
MQQLIQTLLDMAKHETASATATYKKTDLFKLLTKLVKELQPLAKRQQVTIRINKQANQDYITYINPNQFIELSKILLENAVKYNKSGGQVDVALATDIPQAKIIIKISDTGIGIPTAELDKIFARFFRATNHAVAGHGLGLSLAKQLAENLGGEIQITSSENIGTTAIVTIPRIESQA